MEILRASEEKLCDLNKNVVTGSHVLRKNLKDKKRRAGENGQISHHWEVTRASYQDPQGFLACL